MYLIPSSDNIAFRWQVLVQIAAMEELGALEDCVWLFYCQGTPSDQLRRIMKGTEAKIVVWPDWPRDARYNAAMKPWLVGKWLSAHPDRVFEDHTLIDPDVIPYRYDHRVSNHRGVVSGTDTDSYTGPGYLDSKGVTEGLCELVGVSAELFRESPGIGAQIRWNGLPGKWWEDVAKLSIDAFHYMTAHSSDVQAWCSEMYITQMALIRDGWKTQIDPKMSMVWANGPVNKLATAGFFHNAGVVSENPEHFCKLAFSKRTPFNTPIDVSPDSASYEYVEYIRKAETRYGDIIVE